MNGAGNPISEDEFAVRLAGAPSRLIVAVSGGPDSMALARLLAASRPGEDVLAVTVDHGLRPEARSEAEQTGRWCRAAGLQHQILRWEGEKPQTGLQAAARAARYGLLTDLAAREGYDAILTGHTADDQAETLFMRLARGAGTSGLAAMEAATLVAAGAGNPARLIRPLLAFARERILATLGAFDQAYIDDPSNDDQNFERVRTRALLAALEEQTILTREALCRTAERMRAAQDRLMDFNLAAFDAAGGVFHRLGFARLDRADHAPASLIARLIRAVGARDFAPSEEEAGTALQLAKSPGAATLGGAILKREGAGLFIYREPAAVLGRAGVAPLAPFEIAPGARALWDRRFIIENVGKRPFSVVPFGEQQGPWKALFDAPPAMLAAAPAVRGRASPTLIDERPDVRLRSLAKERFCGRVLRFS